jgi:hypothetical protein
MTWGGEIRPSAGWTLWLALPLLALAILASLCWASSAHAETYTVDTPVDTNSGNCTAAPSDCPLRRAVTIANGTIADDVIVLTTDVHLDTAGSESENLNVTGDIDVSGNMGSALTIRSDTGMRTIDSAAAANYRIIDAFSSLTLEDVEITDGNSVTAGVGGGGIHFVGFDAAATLRLDNAYVHDNLSAAGASQSLGGGIAASGVGRVEIVGGSRIEDNVATDPAAGSSGAGGGVSIQGDTDLTVSGSTISGNRAGTGPGPTAGRGGGIDFFNSQAATPNLVVTNSDVTGNRAGGLGSSGTFYRGGGIHAEAQGPGTAVDVDLSGGSVSGNFVAGGSGNGQGQGGGVSVLVNAGAGNGVLTLDGVTVSGNRAGGFDGVGNPSTNDGARGFGAGISTNADTTITGGAVSDNLAGVSTPTPAVNLSGVGAGIYATDGVAAPDLILTGTTLDGNVGGNGNGASSAAGGIYSGNEGAMTLSGVRVTDNVSKGGGGGLLRFPAAAGAADSITDSTISGNQSGFQGGGISLETPRDFSITRSLVSGNTVTGPTSQGGGISARSSSPAPIPLGKLRLVNTTVTGNSAGDGTSILAGGGGIALGFGERIDFEAVFSTIASNTLVSGLSNPPYGRGGNIRYFDSSAALVANLTGTIVSGGSATGTNASGPNCSLGTNVTFASMGGNLEGLDSGGNATTSCGFTNTGLGDQTGVDPLLAPLAANGGPTDTRALPPASSAIDAVPPAVCSVTGLTTDQRAFPRPFPAGGACDAGAYERGPEPTSTTLSCLPAPATVGAATSCTAAVTRLSPPGFPSGTVQIAATGPGTGSLSAGSCTLAVLTGTALCKVSYVPATAGSHGLTATYAGDAAHAGSSGSTAVQAVAPPAKAKKCKTKKAKKRAAASAKKKCKKKKKKK